MIDKRTWRPAAGAVAMMAACAASAEDAAKDRPWDVEVGTGVAYHDNFFHRQSSALTPTESAAVWNAYVSGERDFKAAGQRWTAFGYAEARFNADISDANSQTLRAGGAWRGDRTRVALEAGLQPNLLYSEDGAGEFYDLAGLSLEARHTIGSGMWLSGSVERRRWDFDASQAGRDADSLGFEVALRIPLGERAGLRLLGAWEEKDADDPNNDWDSQGYGVAVELNPSERLSAFGRIRFRDRDYPDAPAADSNFNRKDDIVDAVVNARYRMGPNWGVGAQAEYRDGDSTRLDRNFDATVFSLFAYLSF